MPSDTVDTVVVGGGPAGLLVSYILSGHEPCLLRSRPHPDGQLQAKLSQVRSLFDVDVQAVTSHFHASRFSYSTQALPVNVLLDTLVRPLGDTEPGEHEPCIEWRKTGRRISHLVLSTSPHPGGQWQENPVRASWEIGTLSYADLLSLPGYTIEEHLQKQGRQICEFLRPDRHDVAEYLREYANVVGIQDNIRNSSPVSGVQRVDDGFYIKSHDLQCKHLILASGIFSHLIPPRLQLQPLLKIPQNYAEAEPPLLVVGSGFSAADLIITNIARRKIIHIFKWDPVDCVSPLRACHPQAYPEYASVYRRMKIAARPFLEENVVTSPPLRRKSTPYFDNSQIEMNYEGLPNTWIKEATVQNGLGHVSLELPNGKIIERSISGLEYVIGRRGSLEFLDKSLQEEVLDPNTRADMISGRTLRTKVEENIEIVPDVFVVGSLAGDSLIRHAYGTCVTAAGEVIKRHSQQTSTKETTSLVDRAPVAIIEPSQEYVKTNGHETLGFWNRARRRLSGHADDLEQSKKRRSSLISECVLA